MNMPVVGRLTVVSLDAALFSVIAPDSLPPFGPAYDARISFYGSDDFIPPS